MKRWSDMRKGEDGERRINRLSSGEEESEEQYLVVGGLASKLTRRAGGDNITHGNSNTGW